MLVLRNFSTGLKETSQILIKKVLCSLLFLCSFVFFQKLYSHFRVINFIIFASKCCFSLLKTWHRFLIDTMLFYIFSWEEKQNGKTVGLRFAILVQWLTFTFLISPHFFLPYFFVSFNYLFLLLSFLYVLSFLSKKAELLMQMYSILEDFLISQLFLVWCY